MTRNVLTALLAIATGFAVSLMLPALYSLPAQAQRSPLADGEPCPSYMYKGRDELFCHCGSTAGGNKVWGSDSYTDDFGIVPRRAARGRDQCGGRGDPRPPRAGSGKLPGLVPQRHHFAELRRIRELDRVRQPAGAGENARRCAAVSGALHRRAAGVVGRLSLRSGPHRSGVGTNPYTARLGRVHRRRARRPD